MATLREIELRLKSMKMIASTQLAKAQCAMAAGKQYGIANSEIFANSTSATSTDNRLFIVVSSDKGLCGGIHSSVTKATRHAFAGSAESPLLDAERRPVEVDAATPIMVVGDKAKSQLLRSFAGNLRMTFSQIGRDVPTFADAAGVADLVVKSGVPYDSVVIISNKFVSVEVRGEAGLKKNEFSLANTIFAALTEVHACEVNARGNAMDNASKNAKDMITSLQMQYNRGRKAAITNELVDIITGASVL
ncbi:ATPase, F1 complex, gamma subunit domain-containing protein [Mycena albidolilacea]|uniref:ATPase, F1 complex, gamma subunit domain-containing protein n=1 Tax=Mycena albidolilacea TaxID=1033008 RepID=A0AAD7EJ85_9AGAR|nr:ATPase, F1 complex, gamma subunit domain-containing protein [Mycena albidolilacea]